MHGPQLDVFDTVSFLTLCEQYPPRLTEASASAQLSGSAHLKLEGAWILLSR